MDYGQVLYNTICNIVYFIYFFFLIFLTGLAIEKEIIKLWVIFLIQIGWRRHAQIFKI